MEVLGLIALVLVPILVLVFITSFSDKAKGKNAYADYGPSSKPEHRRQVDEGIELYRRGVAALKRQGHANPEASRVQAVALLEQAVTLGNVQALTGLGIAAREGGDDGAAHDRWLEANAKGDAAGMIFLLLTEHSSVYEDSYKSALRAYLGAMADKNVDDLRCLRDIAQACGRREYAQELNDRANMLERTRW